MDELDIAEKAEGLRRGVEIWMSGNAIFLIAFESTAVRQPVVELLDFSLIRHYALDSCHLPSAEEREQDFCCL